MLNFVFPGREPVAHTWTDSEKLHLVPSAATASALIQRDAAASHDFAESDAWTSIYSF